MRPSRYLAISAEIQEAAQRRELILLADIQRLGEALMCATDHLDFDSLAVSHGTALATIQRGLAIHAGRTGDEPARRRANWTA